MSTEVVERPDDFTVDRPKSDHTLIAPFNFYSSSKVHRSALILLNQSFQGVNLPKLWHATELHVCADGGANQLYQYFDSDDLRSKYVPHFIVGDLDSLTHTVKEYYQKLGSIVIEQTTQYSTDFMKAIITVQLYFHSRESRDDLNKDIDSSNGVAELLSDYSIDSSSEETIQINIVSGIGGRFDQSVHSITQLYKLNKTSSYLQLFFITKVDVIFLLQKGLNYVTYPDRKSFFHSDKVPVCGLLPLGSPVVLNTKGLKYDVHNWPSEMLGNVSSSNGVCGINGFEVDTTDDVVMNIEIGHKM